MTLGLYFIFHSFESLPLSLSLCLAFANGRREGRHTERDKCARVWEDFIGIVSGPNGLCKLSLDFWVGLGLGMTL